MKPDLQHAFLTQFDRLGPVVRWAGVLAGVGISLGFAAIAAVSFLTHDPPARIALAAFFSIAAGFGAIVRALMPAPTPPPPAWTPKKRWPGQGGQS